MSARIVLVTAHRRENWGAGLQGIAEGVARFARAHPDVRVVLPLHPNPRVRRRPDAAARAARQRAPGRAAPLRGDGPAAGPLRSWSSPTPAASRRRRLRSDKPVLVARDSTERTEGVDAGTLRLVGTDPDRIAARGVAAPRRSGGLRRRWLQRRTRTVTGAPPQRIVARARAPAHGRRTLRCRSAPDTRARRSSRRRRYDVWLGHLDAAERWTRLGGAPRRPRGTDGARPAVRGAADLLGRAVQRGVRRDRGDAGVDDDAVRARGARPLPARRPRARTAATRSRGCSSCPR